MQLPKFISTRSTLFGFAAVIVLCAAIVGTLLIQVDTWSRAAFDLVKNNTEQVRLIMSMRDTVQKRELLIQRMINMKEMFDRDEEAVSFRQLAAVYADARDKLLQTKVDDLLLENLSKLDESVAYAQPYHENLVEALVFGGINDEDLKVIIKDGRVASARVLFLLDRIVESQLETHNRVEAKYEQSHQITLVVIALIFAVIGIIITLAVRTSGRQFSRVSRMPVIDDVTGTYNRRYFDMVLEEEWKRSMREYTPLSILMVDIDYFKAYNDNFGHQAGDVCLFSVGKLLSSQLKRSADFTARYGGDEFAIVLPNTSVEHARLLAERLKRSVEEARIKAAKEDVSPWVTVSIGLATTTAEFDQSSTTLVKAAEGCLQESKRAGRNRVTDKMMDDLN
ncbi:MAG: GGDEF domain-containing protein [Gammaproteobacteria bacterium]|nr:GGDEF domain-containing protein [Gammaproteobacteria bacterium]